MRVWVTRAQPGADRTARAVADLGHDPIVAPVLEVHDLPVAMQPPPDTLAFTSANAVAAWGRLTPDRSARVFAVGDATATAVREAGFGDVRSAAGDGAALADLIAQAASAPVLWPRGADIAFDLEAALSGRVPVRSLPVYETRPTTPPPRPDFDALLIQSPRAARLIAETLSAEAARGRLALALSAAAARPLSGLPFATIHIAAHPDEAHLLAPLGKPPPAV
ncbi:MAG: uroporphyrinogen-III synthase [Caulobacteraceae bacterium]|nr:uroporphyrinogen-III synthase [Caulobacteraceae bacterium]